MPGAPSKTSGASGDDRRQRVVVDEDRVARLFGDRRGLGDDRGDRFADEARAFDGERVSRRRRGRRAVRALERRTREGRDAGGDEVLADEHGDDARHAPGRFGVDRDDARVRVRRAQQAQMRLAGRVAVVGEGAAPGDQRVVLQASYGLAAAIAPVGG